MKVLYLLDDKSYEWIYGEKERAQIATLLEFASSQLNRTTVFHFPKELLADVELIVSAWEMPTMDEKLLALFPKLKTIFYGAGTISNTAKYLLYKRLTYSDYILASISMFMEISNCLYNKYFALLPKFL